MIRHVNIRSWEGAYLRLLKSPILDGFVVFDSQNRYQINFPNGWKNIDLK
jgi:hypothetical protein